MNQRGQRTSEIDSFSKLYCPRCGHFVMEQNIAGGGFKIKCKRCKATLELTRNEKTVLIALSATLFETRTRRPLRTARTA